MSEFYYKGPNQEVVYGGLQLRQMAIVHILLEKAGVNFEPFTGPDNLVLELRELSHKTERQRAAVWPARSKRLSREMRYFGNQVRQIPFDRAGYEFVKVQPVYAIDLNKALKSPTTSKRRSFPTAPFNADFITSFDLVKFFGPEHADLRERADLDSLAVGIAFAPVGTVSKDAVKH